MCTLSWIDNNEGYQLFFNRDEQRVRSTAIAPYQQIIDTIRVIMPIDPTGNGSWISVNEFGLSLCLLNYYQGHKRSDTKLNSRGQLLKSLSPLASIADVSTYLQQTDLTQFAPFTLVSFCRQSDATQLAFCWNGLDLSFPDLDCPISSSSVDFGNVVQSRQQQYRRITDISTENLLAYHRSHSPIKGHQSVCMHRSDAKTVSFSQITVNASTITFSYQAGSPCEMDNRPVIIKIAENASANHPNCTQTRPHNSAVSTSQQ